MLFKFPSNLRLIVLFPLLGAMLLAGTFGAYIFVRSHLAPPPPMEISYWYWHRPFHITPDESRELAKMGVRRLFVRAGTYKWQNGAVQITDIQHWTHCPTPFDIVLVFDYDPGVIRRFGTLTNASLSETCDTDVAREKEAVESAGLRVTGVQLDLDCPTRQLPRYADLLRLLRPRFLAEHFSLSVTTLPTWYASPAMADVADAVDFTVPQYYEALIPHSLGQFEPLSHLSLMTHGLETAGRLGRPFYAGIPAYGHALVYDDRGRLVGVFHDMSAPEAARNPFFQFERSYPADAHGQPAQAGGYIGEDLTEFETGALNAGMSAPRYHLVYELPSPRLIANHLALLCEKRPANCLGVILFRFPEPNDPETVPLSAASAVFHDTLLQPSLHMTMHIVSAPWDLIETGQPHASMPRELSITVTNGGNASTFLARDAVTFTLYFDRPGLGGAASREFDTTETFYAALEPGGTVDQAHLTPSSPERANVLRVHGWCISAGQSLTLGPILLPSGGATHCWGSWTARGVGGYDTIRGTIPVTSLASSSDTLSPNASQGTRIQ